jgi:AcrR family transcriptional regulator
MMSECVRDRDGRLVGKRGLATRDRLLDALSGLVGKVGWRRLTPIEVAREAGVSPAGFYQYFPELEDAVIAFAVRLDEAGGGFPEHLRLILCLLEFEGWKLPRFSNNSTIEEW